jgi:hypothetical protein
VNIVLKKDVKLGRTGSVTASANQGRAQHLPEPQHSRRNSYDLLTTTRLLPGGRTISQEAYTRYPGDALFATYGLGLEPAKRLTLNFDCRLTYGHANSESGNATQIR